MGIRRPRTPKGTAESATPARTVHGIAYGVFVGTLSLLSGVILLPIVASQVGAGAYGLWLFLISITVYVGYGDLGVSSAIIHFGARARGGDGQHSMSQLLSAGVLWSAATMVVILPIYVWLAWRYIGSHLDVLPDPETTRIALVAFGAVIAGMAVVRPFGGALVGTGLLVWAQRIGLIALLIRVVGTLVAVYVFGTITAVAAVETLATILPGVVIMVIVLSRVAPLRFSRGMWPTLRLMLGYSTKSLLMGMSQTVVMQGGTLIVGVVAGPANVTYFNLAFRVYTGVRQMITWVIEPFRSTLSRVAASSHSSHLKLVESLTFTTLSLTLVGTVTWALGSQFLVDAWVGDHLPAPVIALVATVLLAGLTLESLHLPYVLAGDTAGKPGIFLAPQVIWGILFVAMGIPLGQQWGIVGVAVAMSAPLLVVEPVFLAVARRFLGLSLKTWWSQSIRPALVFVAPALVAGALCWLATYASAPSLTGWLPAVVFALSSLLSLYLTRNHLPFDDLMAALRSRM